MTEAENWIEFANDKNWILLKKFYIESLDWFLCWTLLGNCQSQWNIHIRHCNDIDTDSTWFDTLNKTNWFYFTQLQHLKKIERTKEMSLPKHRFKLTFCLKLYKFWTGANLICILNWQYKNIYTFVCCHRPVLNILHGLL